MQNNDFDNSIREMLNRLSPEFNPADWARMENMLGSLPPSDMPQAGAGTAGKGLIAAGAKVWVAVAAISVSSVAGGLYYFSEPTTPTAKPVATEIASATNQIQANQAETKALGSKQTPERESVQELHLVTESTSQVNLEPGSAFQQGSTLTQIRAEKLVSKPAAANSALSIPGNSLYAGAAIEQPLLTGSGIPSTSGSLTTYKALLQSAKNNQLQTPGAVSLPCQKKESYLPFLIAGTDTVTTSEFTLSPCEPFCLLIPANGGKKGDDFTISASLLQTEGAHFSVQPENKNLASFCWTPSSAQSRKEAYPLLVTVKNRSCPESQTFTILLKVAQQKLVSITGDSLLAPGQQGRVRVAGNLAEARFKWREDKSIVGTLQMSEILVAPQKTTTYSVQVATANKCMLSASYVVKVADATNSSSIFVPTIPNIFSPNSDQVNDFFEIKGIAPGDMAITILNQWGKEVYQSKNYQNNWNGNSLEDGKYFYRLKQHSTGKEFSGIIEISRKP